MSSITKVRWLKRCEFCSRKNGTETFTYHTLETNNDFRLFECEICGTIIPEKVREYD